MRRVVRSGDVGSKVIEGTYQVMTQAEQTLAAPQDWGTVTLNRDERAILAEAAHLIRFGDSDGEITTPIKPEQLLIPRRQMTGLMISGQHGTLPRKMP